ncbi:hypothetical protein [Paenibacillus sp. FSL R7-0337]|jgi:hypothetical protein|uniref:hypothetical protein n=1 Tax=Paenibacillus sp. FSL R7-0337 TaxID=1926588 RepID=UPI00096FE3CD|nr:hypothetical protein [Paenibacillus sp. FSL R7-0337]OMF98195.1 hypothetical protein BK147_11280 [Paenibacillus sp. FSL R7-0337]
MRNDPYFQDVPWDIITDDCGKVIGEVFLILPDPSARRLQQKRGTTAKRGEKDGQHTRTKQSY